MPTVLVVNPENDEIIEEFEVESGEVIFDQLDAQGKTLPHGCLAGSCGSCRILVIEGSQNLNDPGAIESDTIKALEESYIQKNGTEFMTNKKIRLSCRARVNGNVKIGMIKG